MASFGIFMGSDVEKLIYLQLSHEEQGFWILTMPACELLKIIQRLCDQELRLSELLEGRGRNPSID